MSNDLTPVQQGRLTSAATDSLLICEANNAFSIVLLEAAKQNPNLHTLEFNVANGISREVVLAFADCLDSNPFVESLAFDGVASNGDAGHATGVNDTVKDEYTTLITPIATSQRLKMILIDWNLPLELGEVILEGLKHKSSYTSVYLRETNLIMSHPTAFAELLATGKVVSLHLSNTPCHGVHVEIIRDGLRKCHSLKEFTIRWFQTDDKEMDYKCFLQGLDGNQSLEKLILIFSLDSDGTCLLNKVVSSHEKLATLTVVVPSECVDTLCQAVSQSQSTKALFIHYDSHCHSHDLAISHMLQQSTSLQIVHVLGRDGDVDIKEIAVGLKACKTLTSFHSCYWKYDLKGYWALVDALIVNHSLSELSPLPQRSDHCKWEEVRGREDRYSTKFAHMELLFFLAFNEQGRSLLKSNVPAYVWPYALEKVGRSSFCDALYFFLQEVPELFMH